MKQSQILSIFFSLLLFFAVFPCLAQPQVSRKPALIRDTDVAEGKEDAKEIKVKEQNPALAEQNLKIGNFYYKQKNYSKISRCIGVSAEFNSCPGSFGKGLRKKRGNFQGYTDS
jgi:hypothetical protein